MKFGLSKCKCCGITAATCGRCGKTWVAQAKDLKGVIVAPVACRFCFSRYWNKPRMVKKE